MLYLQGNSGTDSSHGYKPDYYSESKERSVAPGSRSIAGESMASTAYPPSTAYAPSNASPSLAGRSYSRLQHSDTESVRSGNRNVTVARSAAGGDNSSMASSNVPPPTVIQPGRTSANKHSRYAAMY
ncbi:hypothetical protein EB796_001852 [Bugula neritina]|uniref:Uncharacterized protein n=1 Tax=Bugula neritina TaxID=10212 RepID=A0A7J7KNR9_BUGNE|nr:hypothetical protein EB796_001852 [Bugula neritina]